MRTLHLTFARFGHPWVVASSLLILAVVTACGGQDAATGEPDFTSTFSGGEGGTSSAPAPGGMNPIMNGVAPLAPGGGGTQGQGAGLPSSGNPVQGAGGTGMVAGPVTGNTPGAMAGVAGSSAVPPANGGAPPTGTPPVVTLPTPPGQAFFFDDFEGGSAGQQPAAWDSWINYSVEAGNALGNPQFAVLDDAESFRGNQSVHFHTEGATQPAMLTQELPPGLTRLFVRAFVKSRIQVGGVAADAVSNHETLIGLRATPNDGNFELRFGGAKGALGFNIVGPGRNDAVSPQQAEWGSGPGLTANGWQCVEIGFDNTDSNAPVASAWVEGTLVRSVTADWHVGITGQWLNDMFREAMLGWQSFSPAPANDVWMDDVVLSEERVGCE